MFKQQQIANLHCLQPEKVKQEVHGPWRSICLTTAFGMKNGNFMQICTKNSLLQTKNNWNLGLTLTQYLTHVSVLHHFSSAWLCQQSYFVAQASVVRASSVPSVNCGFSETAAWIQTKFMESYLSIISSDSFFLYSKFSYFTRFLFSFSLTWDPIEAKISKRYSYNFHLIWAKL